MLSQKAIAAWAVLIVVVGVSMAVWLLLAYGHGDPRVQLDAIRTAGTVVVGTGGAAALLLAARRQRTTEIALRQKDRDQADVARAHALQERVAAETHAHQERVAAATEHDAAERRLTEQYTKAADQLGSDKAPVRLAGLYALERLAQDSPRQRQTIVNVLCAYLRMPYQPPGELPANNISETLLAEQRGQERQVRVAVQSVLCFHLRPGDDQKPVETFWPDLNLDLTGALLVDFTLTDGHLCSATFTNTKFNGVTKFNKTRFSGTAWFDRARFCDYADFADTGFSESTRFDKATFNGMTRFCRAQFSDYATFQMAWFNAYTSFAGTQFDNVQFDQVQFNMALINPAFEGVRFSGTARFREVSFPQGVPEEVARFVP